MKLKRLAVENFLGLRTINLKLPDPVTLIAGDNDSGKSSLQEAIRFAFTGESARVRLKKHYSQLVRDGASKASVQIEFALENDDDGVARASLPSGEYLCRPKPDPALPFVLDAPRFAALDLKERRRFLFELVGVQTDIDAILKRIEARAIGDELVATVLPMLRGGFEAAEKWASDMARKLRAEWSRLTGEEYGAVKAAAWKPAAAAGPAVDAKAVAALGERLGALKRTQEEAASRLSVLHYRRRQQIATQPEIARLNEQSTAFAAKKQELDEANAAAESEIAVIEKLRARVANDSRRKMECPSCGELLMEENEGWLTVAVAVDDNHVLELKLELEKQEAAHRVFSNDLAMREGELNDMMHAAEKMAAFERGLGTPITDKAIAKAETELEELEARRGALAIEHATASIAFDEQDRASRIEVTAQAIHVKLQAWKAVEAALAPTGIPGELLGEALGPINARLQWSSAASGWAQVSITPDMDILAGHRPYELLSESARWRAQAMISEAISFLAGIRILILDRVDVLAIANREKLLNWTDALVADGYDTIMLFATLKSPPQFNGMNTFWLAKGEVA